MRTQVAPSSTATSKSPLMPMESRGKVAPNCSSHLSRQVRNRAKTGRVSSLSGAIGAIVMKPSSVTDGALRALSITDRTASGFSPNLLDSPETLTSSSTDGLAPVSSATRMIWSRSARVSTEWKQEKSDSAWRTLFF